MTFEQIDMEEWLKRSVRVSDPLTSKLAAESVAPHINRGQLEVLGALMLQPMTDFEIADHVGRQQTSAGKRRGELRDKGFVHVVFDGEGEQVKRQTPSGSLALVWQITDAGRQFYLNNGRVEQ